MRVRHQLPRLAIIVLLLCSATAAFAFPSVARKTKMSCATCHSKVSGGVDLTDAGKAYKADNTKVPATSVTNTFRVYALYTLTVVSPFGTTTNSTGGTPVVPGNTWRFCPPSI